MGITSTSLDGLPVLHPGEFEKISRLAYEHCGVDLRHGKQGLIAARLGKILRELGMPSFQRYYDYVKQDRSGAALSRMVDVLTTNHTTFFREPQHFEFLRQKVWPAVCQRSLIQIWSAACSTGEEPFSIAMTLLEEAGVRAATKFRIKATDISTRVIAKGKTGEYEAGRVGGIPPTLLQRYLQRDRAEGAKSYRFKAEVRAMIDFQQLNLMERLPAEYKCPVIFCRNIMIYFDRPTQQDLVRRLSLNLEEGGYLLIGHSESLNNVAHGLEYVAPATYRKPGTLHGSKMGRR